MRGAGINTIPKAVVASVPASFTIPKRYNSSSETNKTIVDAVNSVDVGAGNSVLEQAGAVVANNAAEIAVASEHSNFIIRNVMSLIDNVHNFVGIPYWEAIALTTIGIRLLLIPVAIKTTQGTARLAHLRPVLQRISEAMQNDPRAASDQAVKARYQKEMQASFLKYKVNPLHAMMWPFAQIPFFLSLFFAVQGMGQYYPGLAQGGASWFTDLTVADPYYIFPVFNALSFLAMIEMGSQDGVQMQQTQTIKNVLRGLAVVTLPLTASMPQSVFIFWSTNNVLSLIQGLALKNPGVKKFLDIPDMPTANVPDLKVVNPVQKLQEYFKEKKDNESNASSEILKGVSKNQAPTTPPPKTFSTPPRK